MENQKEKKRSTQDEINKKIEKIGFFDTLIVCIEIAIIVLILATALSIFLELFNL